MYLESSEMHTLKCVFKKWQCPLEALGKPDCIKAFQGVKYIE